MPQARHGKPAPASAVRSLPLRGEWEQSATTDDIDANGIALTPDRRQLLVVNSNSGKLYRVDPPHRELPARGPRLDVAVRR